MVSFELMPIIHVEILKKTQVNNPVPLGPFSYSEEELDFFQT